MATARCWRASPRLLWWGLCWGFCLHPVHTVSHAAPRKKPDSLFILSAYLRPEQGHPAHGDVNEIVPFVCLSVFSCFSLCPHRCWHRPQGRCQEVCQETPKPLQSRCPSISTMVPPTPLERCLNFVPLECLSLKYGAQTPGQGCIS